MSIKKRFLTLYRYGPHLYPMSPNMTLITVTLRLPSKLRVRSTMTFQTRKIWKTWNVIQESQGFQAEVTYQISHDIVVLPALILKLLDSHRIVRTNCEEESDSYLFGNSQSQDLWLPVVHVNLGNTLSLMLAGEFEFEKLKSRGWKIIMIDYEIKTEISVELFCRQIKSYRTSTGLVLLRLRALF